MDFCDNCGDPSSPIYRDALKKINTDQKICRNTNVIAITGPTGPTGPSGGPTGPTGPSGATETCTNIYKINYHNYNFIFSNILLILLGTYSSFSITKKANHF